MIPSCVNILGTSCHYLSVTGDILKVTRCAEREKQTALTGPLAGPFWGPFTRAQSAQDWGRSRAKLRDSDFFRWRHLLTLGEIYQTSTFPTPIQHLQKAVRTFIREEIRRFRCARIVTRNRSYNQQRHLEHWHWDETILLSCCSLPLLQRRKNQG